MKKISLIILLMSQVVICLSQIRTPRFRSQSFERFIELDSTNLLFVPIEWDSNGKLGDIKIVGNNKTKNIFFYDPITDYKKFLFDSDQQIIKQYKGHLLNRRYNDDDIKRPLNKHDIYYKVIRDDYNGDKKLNSEDPTYLYVSKFDGSELTQLTPKFYHLKYYKYVERSNVILATLVVDENGDRKFNNNDYEVLYKVDLSDLSKSKIVTRLKLKDK